MFNRRDFLFSASALAAGGAARRALATPGNQTKLRLGYLISADSHMGAGASAMAEEVARRTGGRIQIQQFPDAALGGEVAMLKGIQIGAIDMAFITGSAMAAVVPEAAVFNIPFLFDNVAQAHAVLDGPIGDSYMKLVAAKNLVPLAWGENGLRHLTNSRRPVVTCDDVRGMKLRVPQSDVILAAFLALGADAHTLAFPEVYSALESGLFDGEENPLAMIIGANFAKVQKFLTLSGHVYDPILILMSPDAHDDLSDEDKVIFREAAMTGARATRAAAAQADATGVATLRRAGMQVVTSIDRPRFAAAMEPANATFAKMFGQQQIDAVRNAK